MHFISRLWFYTNGFVAYIRTKCEWTKKQKKQKKLNENLIFVFSLHLYHLITLNVLFYFILVWKWTIFLIHFACGGWHLNWNHQLLLHSRIGYLWCWYRMFVSFWIATVKMPLRTQIPGTCLFTFYNPTTLTCHKIFKK